MATVNKQAIAAAFGRAAAHYEQHADYSARVLTPYWQCFHSVNSTLRTGRGLWTWLDEPPLAERHAQVTALDLSPPMLAQARHKDAADHYLAGDIESLPLATATFDLAWSNRGAVVR